MSCSPERLAANRANALKSTGPKTAEGKERSRANARKHGLTGEGIALPTEEADVVAGRFASIRDQFDPRTALGGVLCKRIAMLSVRLDRAYAHEAAALAVRVLSAESSFADARKAEAEHLIQQIGGSPATNFRRLLAMPEGVNALLEHWARMKADLDHAEGCRWSYSHYHKAEHMIGRDSGEVDISPFMAWTMAIHGQYQYLRPERLAGMKTEAEKKIHAMNQIADLVDAEVARLRDHRTTMDTSAADAHRAFAARLALFDASKEAVLARKYEAATERGLFRAIRELREVEAAGHSEDITPEQVKESEDLGSSGMPPAPGPEAPADGPEPADDQPEDEVDSIPQIAQIDIPASKKGRPRTNRARGRKMKGRNLTDDAKI